MRAHRLLTAVPALLLAVTPAAFAADLVGTGGDDSLAGTATADTIHARGGDDFVRAFGGGDQVSGGDGADKVEAGRGRDLVRGGDGRDFLEGGPGDDTVRGGTGRDQLFGDRGDDVLLGAAGADGLAGGGGRDRLRGRSGDDTMYGGAGNDRLSGGADDDSLTDWLPTSFDADGPPDADVLRGGTGDDFIGILNGADVVLAGEGADQVKLDDDGAVDHVDCGPGTDRVTYYGGSDPLDELVECEDVTVE